MRLWSIAPSYLDRQGLLALWREGLLAKKVLEQKTKGYRQHPQLLRFDKDNINYYLETIYQEAINRDYHFCRS